jgi:hypothetical protein
MSMVGKAITYFANSSAIPVLKPLVCGVHQYLQIENKVDNATHLYPPHKLSSPIVSGNKFGLKCVSSIECDAKH